ncbi:hypothetical protein KY358_06895 [Candidatus Woesearchaeota archaeon]|nr:hypothetical protein [Candidatus Woesearchaeota archaeon]
MKPSKQTMVIAALALLLILALSYICIGMYIRNRQQEQLAVFQQGAQYGYEQAVITIIQQAATCQQVPVFIQNQSMNLVAVECLRQGQPEAQD